MKFSLRLPEFLTKPLVQSQSTAPDTPTAPVSDSPFLAHEMLPWLFAVSLAACLPHTLFHPAWLSLAAGSCFVWRIWLWHRGLSLPNKLIKTLLVGAGAVAMILHYHTLFGREAGTAFLFLLCALKLLELRTQRDAYVLVFLAIFLLLGFFLLDQSLFTALWSMATLVLFCLSLLVLNGALALSFKPRLGQSGKLLLQALPFMVLLYVLFPRVNGPLWKAHEEEKQRRTGLSEQMNPGEISELAQNSEIAFRVRFLSNPPDPAQLYWRGPVFESFDGKAWRPGFPAMTPMYLTLKGGQTSYEMTLEPHQQRWLLALDVPSKLPDKARVGPGLVALYDDQIVERKIFQFTANTSYEYNREERDGVLRANLVLPANRNGRAQALAREWVAAGLNPPQIVDKALSLFRNEKFSYTLRPPKLGENPVDEFLFVTRQGFCEHYSSAFVTLMRAAGIPARVVTGYQGGEKNPLDGYFVIRQSDAHAWSEVWLAERGWVRIDPTAMVAPSRVQQGVSAALPAGEPLPNIIRADQPLLRNLRYQWEAINNRWNQWVLGYNQQQQKGLFANLGLGNVKWQQMLSWLLAGCCALILLYLASQRQKRPLRTPVQQLWDKALVVMAKQQLQPEIGETPIAFARRARKHCAAPLSSALGKVAKLYCRIYYGSIEQNQKAIKSLDAAVKALRQASKTQASPQATMVLGASLPFFSQCLKWLDQVRSTFRPK